MKKKVQLFVNDLERDIIVQSLLSWKKIFRKKEDIRMLLMKCF